MTACTGAKNYEGEVISDRRAVKTEMKVDRAVCHLSQFRELFSLATLSLAFTEQIVCLKIKIRELSPVSLKNLDYQ